MQIFTRNATQWQQKPLSDQEIRKFKERFQSSGIHPVVSHAAYLINLASGEQPTRERSLATMKDELLRAESLEIPWVVLHPGAHRGAGEQEGLRRLIRSLDQIHLDLPGLSVITLLETTAGMGTSIGCRFEHLSAILSGVREPERLGICLDTCHIFAAGYDLRTADAFAETRDLFDHLVGIDCLRVIHLNDSKRELGAHVDRHTHIGEGHIGVEGFRQIVNEPRFRRCPMILETPKEDTLQNDRRNLRLLRSLCAKENGLATSC